MTWPRRKKERKKNAAGPRNEPASRDRQADTLTTQPPRHVGDKHKPTRKERGSSKNIMRIACDNVCAPQIFLTLRFFKLSTWCKGGTPAKWTRHAKHSLKVVDRLAKREG